MVNLCLHWSWGVDILPFLLCFQPLYIWKIRPNCFQIYSTRLTVTVHFFIEKPFHLFFRLFRENWDIRTSVIDSFATFFLLSYVKILSTSIDMLLATRVRTLNSNKTQYRLYYAGNIEFLHGDHIPFAVLAISMLTVFIVVPTLILICYPFQCFQKCLLYYQIQLHCLRTFVDSFQGCYKDGTEPDTYDLRLLSSYGLILRLCIGA